MTISIVNGSVVFSQLRVRDLLIAFTPLLFFAVFVPQLSIP